MSETRKPELDGNGLPTCTSDRCPQWDGKRCRETGFRTGYFCEPQLLEDYERLKQLVARRGGT